MINIPAKTLSHFIVFVLIRTGQFDALLFHFFSVEMLRQKWVKCRTLKVLSKRNSLKWKRKSSRRTRTLMLVTLVSVWLGLKGRYAVCHFLQNCKRGTRGIRALVILLGRWARLSSFRLLVLHFSLAVYLLHHFSVVKLKCCSKTQLIWELQNSESQRNGWLLL